MLRVVVTGGRYFNDRRLVANALGTVHQTYGIAALIHGCASGVDTMCGEWAIAMRVPVDEFRAAWADIDAPGAVVKQRRDGTPYNVLAGFQRNQQMIDVGRPDYAVAFPGGRGTADMVGRIERAGIALWDLRCQGPPS